MDSASSEDIDIDHYKPTILPDRRWKLSEVDLGQPSSSMMLLAVTYLLRGRMDCGRLRSTRYWRRRFILPAFLDGKASIARRKEDLRKYLAMSVIGA